MSRSKIFQTKQQTNGMHCQRKRCVQKIYINLKKNMMIGNWRTGQYELTQFRKQTNRLTKGWDVGKHCRENTTSLPDSFLTHTAKVRIAATKRNPQLHPKASTHKTQNTIFQATVSPLILHQHHHPCSGRNGETGRLQFARISHVAFLANWA